MDQWFLAISFNSAASELGLEMYNRCSDMRRPFLLLTVSVSISITSGFHSIFPCQR